VNRSTLALPLFLVLGSCSAAHDDATTSASAIRAGSTDPLEHLAVIAAADMEGRGTGTPGHQRAAEYVAKECQAAGLTGAFAGTDTPYFQPFTVGGFLPVAAESTSEPEFGSELFEDGLFVSGNASSKTLTEMSQKLCEAWQAAHQACPLESSKDDPRDHVLAKTKTQNVVAILPGSGPHKDEIILLTAHLDHLGRAGTGIYFGADDNGSGSSALLAVMHQLTQAQHSFDRTIAFLWTSAEERGLLGSAYFVDNAPPSLPLAKTKQVVNLDMVGRWNDTYISLGTDGNPTTDASVQVIEAANQAMDPPFVNVNRDIQQYSKRQDGYSFSRKGVPSLFVFEGLSIATGGGNLIPQYHKMTDTIDALMADNGGSKLRRVTKLVTLAVKALAEPAPATE
jgi:hypothetical protein